MQNHELKFSKEFMKIIIELANQNIEPTHRTCLSFPCHPYSEKSFFFFKFHEKTCFAIILINQATKENLTLTENFLFGKKKAGAKDKFRLLPCSACKAPIIPFKTAKITGSW